MSLQGTMTPDQLISLMDFGGPSFAMADHADHVHVGYSPQFGPGSSAEQAVPRDPQAGPVGAADRRIGDIDNPDVPTSPSRYAHPDEAQGREEGERPRSGVPRARGRVDIS